MPPVKYSDLAAKVSGRSSMNGRKIESTIDRWLEATIAPPARGMCSAPVISGRHSPRRNGPTTTLETWYFTRPLHQPGPVSASWRPLTITGRRPSSGGARPAAGHRSPAASRWSRPPSGADVLAGGPGREAGGRLRGRPRAGVGGASVVAAQHQSDLAGARHLLQRGAVDPGRQQLRLLQLAGVVLDQRLGHVLRAGVAGALDLEAVLLEDGSHRVFESACT